MSPTYTVLKAVILLVVAGLIDVACTPPRSSPQETKKVYKASLFERAIQSWAYLLRVSFGVICIFPAIAFSTPLISRNSDSAARIANALCPNPSATPASASSITSVWCIGCAMAIGGACLRIWCYKQLASFFTFQVVVQKKHKLITTGPYAVVRHPSYIGFYLMEVGVPLMTFGNGGYFAVCGIMSTPARWAAYAWLALLLYCGIFVWRRIGGEEAMLTDAFGEEWLRYRQRVPYRLLPGVV